ncbi:purine-cytosine permease [Exophiala viscosa]|uniref:Purine-cytosine permease n=1 Tax=Exophiala viscosa TaxID=2486360 RepID=A0AAN6E279_9EURO|nr:purine-cytosine permease [Exophiala viscosa]
MTTEYEKKELELTVDAAGDRQAGQLNDKSFLFKTRAWIRKIGAEEIGIERIPEEMRTNQNPRDLFTIFFSANCNAPTLALGFLGPTLFGLGFRDSFCCLLFFNLFGALFPAMVACFGPKLGLRTMIIPRYSFGWWPAKILAILNCINQIGWAMVNAISGASVLYDVGNGKLPLTVCVLIIGLLAVVLSLFGYKVLHLYDRYSWIVILICFIILAGFGGSHFVNLPMGSGSLEASNVMSFSTSIIGFEIAWLPVAADYGVYMRDTTPDRKSFGWAYAGFLTSQLFVEVLGAAIGTLYLSSDTYFTDAYDDRGIGGLIGACFGVYGSGARGFGKFIEVLIALSCVAVITTNIYSLGLSVQMVTRKLIIVPRFVWSLLGAVIFLAAAIAGRDHLEEAMSDFLLICAYWIVPFATILLLEHFIWRRGYQYDLTAWNDSTKLPLGIAASVAWIVGTVLSLLCMSQTWWVGPIAAGIGGSPYGTDISWILGFVVTAVVYVPLRMWEQKKWHRY